ncbi:small RNA 2'-O-methyltransferase-like [Uloborus diversus]|uniref:small RNA 2'-O-methyltransferase-like n=1 Tax=Uloborus diversus TaxID=327109 RepID=UPI00240A53E4|nr:small RNA 2'-O-methyltransferase-like [Uloborus diversus]
MAECSNETVKQKNCVKEELVEQGGPVFDPPVYIQRYTTVRDILYKTPGIYKIVDFGCAEGKFIKYLRKLPFVTEIACVDVNEACLDLAASISRPTAWDHVFKRHEDLSIKIFKGNAGEKDSRLLGYSAVTCIELIEHLQSSDLAPLVSNIFGYIRPKIALFTTPNSEFNVLFPQLKGFRHWDHKFEWTREEFRQWCKGVIDEYTDYTFEMQGVGEPPNEYSHLGGCSQLAVFRRNILADSPMKTNCSDHSYVMIDENCYPGRASQPVSKSNEISSESEGCQNIMGLGEM